MSYSEFHALRVEKPWESPETALRMESDYTRPMVAAFYSVSSILTTFPD
jgi:hypothetical protein